MNDEKKYVKRNVTGKVIHVVEKKGYGFILSEDPTMNDIFVSFRSIEPWRSGFKTLKKDDEVCFDIVEGKIVKKTGKPGLEAINVEILREKIDKTKFKKERDYNC